MNINTHNAAHIAPKSIITRGTTYRAIYSTVLALTVSLVFARFVFQPGFNGYYRAMFGDMIYGQAYKPFVYRTLLPSSVRAITSLIPPTVRESINQASWPINNWEQNLFTEYLVASMLMCASLMGIHFTLKYFFNGIFQASETFVDLVSLVALVCLPFFFKYYNYIYDFPTLLLFTLGLGLMVRRKWWLFLIVFSIGCLNKETTILLTMVFTIYYFGRWSLISRKMYILLLLSQFSVFLLTRVAFSWVFRNNPGSMLEFHLLDHNVEQLSRPFSPIILLCLLIIIFITYKWSEKPTFLKVALCIAAPLLLTTLFFGFLDELRDYYELYPILVLLIAHSVARIFGQQITTLPSMRTKPPLTASQS